jgi:hypothetical protein
MDSVTVIELALMAFKANLQELSNDPRERFIELQEGHEVNTKHEEKLRVIRNIQKRLPRYAGTPDPQINGFWPRLTNDDCQRLMSIRRKDYDELTDEEKQFLHSKDYNNLIDEQKQIIRDDRTGRIRFFWNNIGQLADEYLNVLVDAVEKRCKDTGDGAPVLEKLREILSSRISLGITPAVDQSQQTGAPVKDQGKENVKCLKKPKGYRGWACEQISKMPEIDRTQFLNIHSGEQAFHNMLYEDDQAWIKRWKKAYPRETREQFKSAVEKGKQLCKKHPDVLNLFTEN